METFNLRSNAELVLFALKQRLISTDPELLEPDLPTMQAPPPVGQQFPSKHK
jgi:hypothetical protein